MVEKREKKLLEQKIAALQGQLLNGGDGMQVTPAVRCGQIISCIHVFMTVTLWTWLHSHWC